MGKGKSENPKRSLRPALTPESEENQMISLAVDLAKKQLQEGTASSQVITHFLKLGSTKAELEREKLKHENDVLVAKAEALRSNQRTEELFEQAINAMKRYSGNGDSDDY